MEEEDGENLTPFWQQSSSLLGRRRGFSSFFLNSGLLLFLLCITALFFIFIVVPSILSFTAQIFRPNMVKKSWDSLNVVLVLVALVIGFLSRIKNYDSRFEEDNGNVLDTIRNEVQKSSPLSPRQWYEHSDQTVYGGSSAIGGLSLRNSSSYPDLREVSSSANADDRWRFFDDTQVDSHRHLDSDRLRRRPNWKGDSDGGGDVTTTIHVETMVNRAKEVSYTPPPPPSSPPPSPPLAAVHRKPKRTYGSVALKDRRNERLKESGLAKFPTPPVIAPQPSPSSPVSPEGYSENKSIKSERKRGDANTTFFASIYHQKKKKRQRQKSVDNFETLLQNQDPLHLSVFPNLFASQKGKTKKILSVPPPPPPLPPPPPITTVRASQKTPQIPTIAAREPPLPVNISRFNNSEENSNSGGESPLTGSESPLISIPPPPPPPPFKMPSWKFVVKGDYVRIGSMNSSRSGGSSDHDDAESATSDAGGTPTAGNGGEAVASLFCSSPDVNTKADMFIAKFRAGLQLQKVNSMKKKQGLGPSNLGP
ncbi:hypothetical protein U1Q18_006427 [Sarracenia purpurea var. burkii]